jgi:hypothetical protein
MAAPHRFQFGREQWQCHGARHCFFYERAGRFMKILDKNVNLWTEKARILDYFSI